MVRLSCVYVLVCVSLCCVCLLYMHVYYCVVAVMMCCVVVLCIILMCCYTLLCFIHVYRCSSPCLYVWDLLFRLCCLVCLSLIVDAVFANVMVAVMLCWAVLCCVVGVLHDCRIIAARRLLLCLLAVLWVRVFVVCCVVVLARCFRSVCCLKGV